MRRTSTRKFTLRSWTCGVDVACPIYSHLDCPCLFTKPPISKKNRWYMPTKVFKKSLANDWSLGCSYCSMRASLFVDILKHDIKHTQKISTVRDWCRNFFSLLLLFILTSEVWKKEKCFLNFVFHRQIFLGMTFPKNEQNRLHQTCCLGKRRKIIFLVELRTTHKKQKKTHRMWM